MKSRNFPTIQFSYLPNWDITKSRRHTEKYLIPVFLLFNLSTISCFFSFKKAQFSFRKNTFNVNFSLALLQIYFDCKSIFYCNSNFFYCFQCIFIIHWCLNFPLLLLLDASFMKFNEWIFYLKVQISQNSVDEWSKFFGNFNKEVIFKFSIKISKFS